LADNGLGTVGESRAARPLNFVDKPDKHGIFFITPTESLHRKVKSPGRENRAGPATRPKPLIRPVSTGNNNRLELVRRNVGAHGKPRLDELLPLSFE